MTPSFYKALSGILLTVFLNIQLFAQSPGQAISGAVRDADGKPLAAVTVSLKGTNFTTLSDETGRYSLAAPAGKYELVVSLAGFKSSNRIITLLPGTDLVIPDIVFSDGLQLEGVEVTGKSANRRIKEQAFNLNVLDAKKLYNTSADLNHALNQTSGVRVREEGGVGSSFSFSLNGFSGRQVKFFLDGIPMDNFGSSLTLNNFPVNMADRVEIYKGVVPVSLGADALGGAVNIITRANPNFLDVSYGYGSFNTHKASVNHAYTNAKSGFTVRTNAFYNFSDNNYKVRVQPIDLATGQKQPAREVERFHDSYQSIGAQVEAGITNKKYADKLLLGV
ncbi:MAG: TonB-dependent receptor, partial [Chitinophagaceae bacterium]